MPRAVVPGHFLARIKVLNKENPRNKHVAAQPFPALFYRRSVETTLTGMLVGSHHDICEEISFSKNVMMEEK